MPADLILAIDQGTSNTKAVLVDSDGAVIRRSSHPVGISYPAPGWVEQDANEIVASAAKASAEVLAGEHRAVAAIGISNQRESILAWHAVTGEALSPAITWQCRRTAAFCEELKASGAEPEIIAKTGLPIDPLFPSSKARWLLEFLRKERPSVDRADIRLGTIDSWLLWRLTGGKIHACDASNASRTQLFNIREGAWDGELLALFDVPRSALPEVKSSNALFGIARDEPFAGLVISGMIGDSHAALFAHGATEPGKVKATYGTGSSIMTPLSRPIAPKDGITTTIAWSLGGKATYAFEGNIAVSASSFPWAAKLMGLGADASRIAELATSVPGTDGVYFVPALTGLGAPYWDSAARGLVSGLTFNTGQAQLARAVMESVPYQVHDVFAAMARQAGHPLTELLVDGGASNNDWLMQFQADILGLPVIRSGVPEASAQGAALIAGLGIGLWPDLAAISTLPREHKTVSPAMAAEERAARLKGWHDAIARTRLRP
jgi:glycerol kinase